MAEMQPYRPSNGTEGDDFTARWCDRCRRETKFRETEDGADACHILQRTFFLDIDDPDYPPEWVAEDGFRNPRCTAFEAEKPERCPDTMELPL